MLSEIFHPRRRMGWARGGHGGREIPGLGLGGDARAAPPARPIPAAVGIVTVGGNGAHPAAASSWAAMGKWPWGGARRRQAAPGTHGCPRAGRYSPCPVHFGSWQQPRLLLRWKMQGLGTGLH